MMQLREHFREYLREAGLLDNSDKGSDGIDGGRDRGGKEVGDDAADDDLISSRHVKVGATIYEDSATVITASATRGDVVNWNIVLGVICAGLYPQVVRLGRFKEKARKGSSSSSSSSSRHRSSAAGVQESIKLVQHDLQDVALHPSSLLAGYVRDILEEQQKKKEGEDNVASDAFLVYYKKVNSDLCPSLSSSSSVA